MDTKELGRKVHARRQELGLSQQILANRADISRNYVSLIERGEAQNVSTAVLGQLATALQLTAAELLEYRPQQHSSQIPAALWEFALTDGLSAETVDRIVRIPRRGKEPQTAEGWRQLYEAIRPYIEHSD